MKRTRKKKKRTRLEEYKRLCRKYLVIENDDYIDVIFAVVFANRLDSKPVWLWLIAPPGGGKSENLQSLTGCEEIYPISSLTAQTLASGMKVEDSKKDPSLLPRIDGKVLVFKDFTSMLQKRRETFADIMGQLRDAYDGTLKKVWGTGKEELYHSKFGIIAGVTPAIDSHQKTLGPLGERFLSYMMSITNRTRAYRKGR